MENGNPSVSGVFIPLWQRGIKGDFKIMLIKSSLCLCVARRQVAPLCLSKDRKRITKEGYKGTFVLLEPITEGLRKMLQRDKQATE
jgi:hypothetical protein